jgi:hypothetical protein
MHVMLILVALGEAATEIHPDRILPGARGLNDHAPGAALASDVDQMLDQGPANSQAPPLPIHRDTDHTHRIRAFGYEAARADKLARYLRDDERLPGLEVVRVDIVDIWIERFVDKAPVLAQSSQDQPPCRDLIVRLEWPDLKTFAGCVGLSVH